MRKMKLNLGILINILFLLLIVTITFSWMVTEPSVGEMVRYDKSFIITASDIDVDAYMWLNDEYVLQTESPMVAGLMEPGRTQNYRFDITNNADVRAAVRIMFSDITGDVEELKEHFLFGSVSPTVFEIVMEDKLVYTSSGAYMIFKESFSIPANETRSIFWYARISEEASNEIMEMSLEIDSVLFTRP